MTDDLRALTVKQPHAWAIASGNKDVENRPWKFWLPLGSSIAIHAGVADDRDGLGVPCRVPDDLTRGAIIGLVDVVACVQDSPSRWARPGQWHWLLANARLLDEPVPARGHLHLWRVGPTIAARITHPSAWQPRASPENVESL